MARRYTTNEDYFSCVDSERKAYFLGFIMADGCIRPSKDNRQASLSIGLHHSDSLVLQELLSDVVPDGKVSFVHSPSIQRNGHAPQVRIRITSNRLVQDLSLYGVRHRKTYSGMSFPSLSSELLHHFIRGYFDGNGGITVNEVKNRYVRVSTYHISNSFKRKLRKRVYFCGPDLTFLECLLKCLPVSLGTPYYRFKRSCHVFSFERGKDVEILEEYLYKDATIYLERKRSKFNMTISSQASDTSEEGSETTGGVQTP